MEKAGRPLKILFLLEDLFYGGTQKQNLELAGRLDKNLFAPTVLSLAGPGDLEDLPKKRDVPVIHMSSSRSVAPFFFVSLGARLRALKPDVLVPCTALPNIWGRLWGKTLKTPVIVGTCRGGGAPTRQREKLLWRLANHIVCNSPALVTAMTKLGVPREKLSYIANGVDCERFAPAPNRSENLILCVARLAPDKDLITLLRAFALAARKNSDLKLRLVGEGPEEKKLKAFVANLPDASARERVCFAGASADPTPNYREAGVFALSSAREGQPNAIMEAMSCGLPVCATAVGGVPELVGDLGLLSPAGDAESLAANILALAANPDLRQRLGAASREKIKNNFSFEAMVSAFQNLFLNLWQKREVANVHA